MATLTRYLGTPETFDLATRAVARARSAGVEPWAVVLADERVAVRFAAVKSPEVTGPWSADPEDPLVLSASVAERGAAAPDSAATGSGAPGSVLPDAEAPDAKAADFDTALRWRSGLYKFGLGLAVNPLVAFVNGSINAAVFGDKNGVKHCGLDALAYGGVAALDSLAGGAFGPGALKFGVDAYLAGRFWRKAGILDIGIKLGEKLIDAQLNKLFQGWLGLNDKYLRDPTPENGTKP